MTGKSSLLNLLANREAAIVSPIAGTTRDVIEVTLDLGGVRCIVSDTAGVRETSITDVVEVEGIKRARKVAAEAHILVCMIDATDSENGFAALNDILYDCFEENEKNLLLLHNKVDLLESIPKLSQLSCEGSRQISESNTYQISCEKNIGVDQFVSELSERVINRVTSDDDQRIEDDGTVITRARHRQHVASASEALRRFQLRSGEGYMALDLAAEELRLAATELGRITGAVDVEDVLDVLFSDFCIGK